MENQTTANWTVLVPTIIGALALAYLLPTAKRRPLTLGYLAGTLAIAGGIVFALAGYGRDFPLTVEAGLFAAFSLSAITFAGLMITRRNPARAALCFALVVLSVCGLFLLLAAPFLMAATIIIYAGAIVVTFLFVIMLSQQQGVSNADDRSREPYLASAIGFIILASLLVGLQRVYDYRQFDAVIAKADQLAQAKSLPVEYVPSVRGDSLRARLETQPTSKAKEFCEEVRQAVGRLKLGEPKEPNSKELQFSEEVQEVLEAVNLLQDSLFKSDDPNDFEDVKRNAEIIRDNLKYLKQIRERGDRPNDIVISDRSLVHSVNDESEARQLPAANVSAVARSLFSDHILAVEMAGTLLLIATIGAIAIAGRSGRKE
jgi:NADH:ubiquinone oxidoreductase subunit 6 (subunit J)